MALNLSPSPLPASEEGVRFPVSSTRFRTLGKLAPPSSREGGWGERLSAGIVICRHNSISKRARKVRQRDDRPRGVVGIRHPAGQVCPSPAAGRGIGIGVLRVILAGENPASRLFRIDFREFAGRGQRGDGAGGHPHGEIGIDGPTAVGAERLAEEVQAAAHHRLLRAIEREQAHGDEAGERGGIEKTAMLGLDAREFRQHGVGDQGAEDAR